MPSMWGPLREAQSSKLVVPSQVWVRYVDLTRIAYYAAKLPERKKRVGLPMGANLSMVSLAHMSWAGKLNNLAVG